MRLPVDAPYNNLKRYMTTAFGVPDGNAAFKKHAGIDIATPIGTPLYAMVSGTVSTSTANIYHGNALDIFSDGKWYRTMHMKSFSTTSGHVNEGQLIGYSGNTGVLAVGGGQVSPHLHFDVRTQYKPTSFAAFVDPLTLGKEEDMTELEDLRMQVEILRNERDKVTYPQIASLKEQLASMTTERDILRSERDNVTYPEIASLKAKVEELESQIGGDANVLNPGLYQVK